MDRLPFAGFNLSEAGQLYARRFEERSRNLGLDFVQSRALLVLAENEGVTQQRLSELTAIASPWLVRILDRLEVLGLAERRPHLADRTCEQGQLIALTCSVSLDETSSRRSVHVLEMQRFFSMAV
jgi:DNA-binding MarR family transcriptional regulator